MIFHFATKCIDLCDVFETLRLCGISIQYFTAESRRHGVPQGSHHSITNNETAWPSKGVEITSSSFSIVMFLGPSINFNRLDCSSVAYCALLTTCGDPIFFQTS